MSPTIAPELWLGHIEAWKQANISQAEYCRTKGVSPHQFSYWKRKLRIQSSAVQQKVSSGFAVAQFETITTTQQALSVTLPDGTTLNDIHAANINVAAAAGGTSIMQPTLRPANHLPKVYLYRDPIDFRKADNGLSTIKQLG